LAEWRISWASRWKRIQTAFPDCEAMREVAPGKWQREKVEF